MNPCASIRNKYPIMTWHTRNIVKVLQHRGINLKTRLRAIQCYVWSTLFYGAETWTIIKSLLSRLDAFEMLVYRRELTISWTEKTTNEEVLRRMGTGGGIVRQFNTRKLQYLGHLIRHNSSQLQITEGNIRRQNIPGPTKKDQDNCHYNYQWNDGMKYYQKKRAAEDRKRWHGFVVNLTQEKTLR